MNEDQTSPFGVRTAAIRDPDQLNHAIHLTSRSTWLILLILGICVATAVAWGFVGRLAFYVQGTGVILLRSGQVFDVTSTASGPVKTIHVVIGQKVAKDEVLFTIQLDELAARRKSAAETLSQQLSELARYDSTSQADIARRRADLDQQLKSLQSDLDETGKEAGQLTQIYQAQQQELDRGYTTRPQVQVAFDRLNSVQQSLRAMNDKVANLKTSQIEFEDSVSRTLAEMRMRVTSAQGAVDDFDTQIAYGGTIRSPADGTVAEISTQVNTIVAVGNQLAVVETGSRELQVYAYLPIAGGKRVSVGMPAEVSPTSVERDIYGSVRGVVTSVSALPVTRQGLMSLIGDADLVASLMAGGAPIEVQIALETDRDTPSGLRWTSSSGSPRPITSGTTASSMVLVRHVRPVSLVLPIAQTWFDL